MEEESEDEERQQTPSIPYSPPSPAGKALAGLSAALLTSAELPAASGVPARGGNCCVSTAMNFPQAESRAPNPELLTCQEGQRKSFSFNEYFLSEACALRRRSDRLSLKMDWPTLPINHLD